MDVRIVAYIDNQWGSFLRLGDQYTVPTSQITNSTSWSIPNGYITYPDANCTKLDILYYDGSQWRNAKSLTTTKSSTGNMAYAVINTINLVGGEIFTLSDLLIASAVTVEDKRRFIASEIGIPFVFRASKTYYVDDEITAFGTNAMDVSSGQFGSFPLFVFTKNSRYVYGVDTSGNDVFLSNATLASLTRGCHNNRTIVNAGQIVAVADRAGIFLIIGSKEQRISDPVWDDLKNTLDSMAMAYHEDGEIRELWIHNGTAYYIFNLDHQKWYKSIRTRSYCFSFKGKVYGVNGILLVTDTTQSTNNVSGTVNFKSLDFEAPEYYKKVREFYVRGVFSGNPTITSTYPYITNPIVSNRNYDRGPAGSVETWQPKIEATFTQDSWFQGLDVKFELRRTHRKGYV